MTNKRNKLLQKHEKIKKKEKALEFFRLRKRCY